MIEFDRDEIFSIYCLLRMNEDNFINLPDLHSVLKKIRAEYPDKCTEINIEINDIFKSLFDVVINEEVNMPRVMDFRYEFCGLSDEEYEKYRRENPDVYDY